MDLYPERFNAGSIQSIYLEIYFSDELHRESICRSGTGFLVANSSESPRKVFLVTAKHNFTGLDFFTNDPLGDQPRLIKIFLPHRKQLRWKPIEIPLYNRENNPLWIEHPTKDTDIALLEVHCDELLEYGLPYVDHIVVNPRLNVTDSISVVGFPLERKGQYLAIWTTGFVATDPELDFHFKGEEYPFFLISAKTWHGQSGSPVYTGPFAWFSRSNERFYCDSGGFIHLPHMYSGRLNPKEDGKSSDVGIVWKNTVIREIFHHAIGTT
ncbi:hypothetical protein GCM10009007_19700 [Formosimonas limnophila]|uniref:Trypsin-like peptidase domain-containing protein n=1 Tax=Formosimonas limnophila TaxID=1384487 RepID=A0A8J3CLY2_9BURK|nr:serine protease [Formosimonas limnophila]GHA78636.1 hypothetical protein GCM10009007_19700 [Formosimonas limnophila]